MRALTRWLVVMLLLGLCAGGQAWAAQVAVPPLDSPVVDLTGTLDAAQRQQLEQQALALQQRKGSQLQVLIVPSTGEDSIEQYTQRVFDAWKLGRKGVDDGVLLVVAKDDRRVRIEPGYGLEGAIPDAVANRVIQEYLVPHFRNGDYAGGIQAATAVLVTLVDGEQLPAPVSAQDNAERGHGPGWPVALVIGFIAANIARGLFRAVPRPLRMLFTAAAGGGAALLFTGLFLASGIAALIGGLLGLSAATPGRFVRHGGWGGGGFGGGGFGGGGFGGGGGGS